MEALKKAGDVIPIASLMRWPSSRRPAFAVTFDDDDAAHVTHALPILRTLNIPATFFLSGRSLHGLGAYWWTQLQQAVDEDGLDATCRRLGRTARHVRELARQCRADGGMQDLPTRAAPRIMQPSDIRQLADAGMAIGFHTLRHPALTLLDDRDLATALTEGRDALASAAHARIESILRIPMGSPTGGSRTRPKAPDIVPPLRSEMVPSRSATIASCSPGGSPVR